MGASTIRSGIWSSMCVLRKVKEPQPFSMKVVSAIWHRYDTPTKVERNIMEGDLDHRVKYKVIYSRDRAGRVSPYSSIPEGAKDLGYIAIRPRQRVVCIVN